MTPTSSTLANALSATSRTVTVASGTLALNDLIAVVDTAPEFLLVTEIITATQARVQRGVNGTTAAAHDSGAEVQFGVASLFLNGPQILPAFGVDGDGYVGQGPTEAATFVDGGGGNPGGADGSVQYNNAGAFGGITGSNWDGTLLTLPTLEIDGRLGIGTPPDFDPSYEGAGIFGVVTNLVETSASAILAAWETGYVATNYNYWNLDGLDGNIPGVDVVGNQTFVGTWNGGATWSGSGIIGTYSDGLYNGTGTFNNIDGGQFYGRVDGGAQITSNEARVSGFISGALVDGADTDVGNAYGAQLYSQVTSATVVNTHGARLVSIIGGGATVTNNYLLSLGAASGAANNWLIYADGGVFSVNGSGVIQPGGYKSVDGTSGVTDAAVVGATSTLMFKDGLFVGTV